MKYLILFIFWWVFLSNESSWASIKGEVENKSNGKGNSSFWLGKTEYIEAPNLDYKIIERFQLPEYVKSSAFKNETLDHLLVRIGKDKIIFEPETINSKNSRPRFYYSMNRHYILYGEDKGYSKLYEASKDNFPDVRLPSLGLKEESKGSSLSGEGQKLRNSKKKKREVIHFDVLESYVIPNVSAEGVLEKGRQLYLIVGINRLNQKEEKVSFRTVFPYSKEDENIILKSYYGHYMIDMDCSRKTVNLYHFNPEVM